MKSYLDRKLNQIWYGRRGFWSYLLWPFSLLYQLVLWVRSGFFKTGLIKVYKPSVPVLVIGNITLGGVGKSPVVSALADYFIQKGRTVGIVSRGYRGKSKNWPQIVNKDSDPMLVGDEPVMLARQVGCWVVVSPSRVQAIQCCEKKGCDLILCDDGLSHYYFEATFECVVVDAKRGLGNGFCLPAGPLRESRARLDRVSAVLTNTPDRSSSNNFCLKPLNFMTLLGEKTLPLDFFKGKPVHAVSGIGNNQRFFDTLRRLGCEVMEHPFPDHHLYSDQDVAFEDKHPIIMTEKDAVKCERLTHQVSIYYLSVRAAIDPLIYHRIDDLIKS
jgi:tetraacyldisaccharide 4'-kinase